MSDAYDPLNIKISFVLYGSLALLLIVTFSSHMSKMNQTMERPSQNLLSFFLHYFCPYLCLFVQLAHLLLFSPCSVSFPTFSFPLYLWMNGMNERWHPSRVNIFWVKYYPPSDSDIRQPLPHPCDCCFKKCSFLYSL